MLGKKEKKKEFDAEEKKIGLTTNDKIILSIVL